MEFDYQRTRTPRIATSASGDTLTVWEQSVNGQGIRWRAHRAGVGWWNAPGFVQSGGYVDESGGGSKPAIAMDSSGNALAAFLRRHPQNLFLNVYANQYLAGNGWTGTELVRFNGNGSAGHPSLAMNARGDGIVAWRQSDGTNESIYYSRYTPQDGWELGGLVERLDGKALDPVVALDDQGNGLAVWLRYDEDKRIYDLWANRFLAGNDDGS
ncbi:MAG: hypothetical protein ACC631_10135, partial [Halocynthiibacter sp.]